MHDEDLRDRYGKNFTIRFTTEEKKDLEEHAERDRIKPTTLIRRALDLYYKEKKADIEVQLVHETLMKDLPLLITIVVTERGKKALQDRMIGQQKEAL